MAIESSSLTTHAVYHPCQEEFFNGLLAVERIRGRASTSKSLSAVSCAAEVAALEMLARSGTIRKDYQLPELITGKGLDSALAGCRDVESVMKAVFDLRQAQHELLTQGSVDTARLTEIASEAKGWQRLT